MFYVVRGLVRGGAQMGSTGIIRRELDKPMEGKQLKTAVKIRNRQTQHHDSRSAAHRKAEAEAHLASFSLDAR